MAAPPGPRAQAFPLAKLVAGESLRYRLEYRSTIHSDSSGPIYNPEQAHTLTVSLTAMLRLDVLAVTPDSRGGHSAELRATYESTDARVQSDAFDPGADALENRYRGLENQSFEFTVDAAGRVTRISSLDRLEPDERVRESIRQWLSTLSLPLGSQRSGMKPGARWHVESPVAGSPLAGLTLKTEAVYRGNEACPPAPGASPGASAGNCAVIATRLRSVARGHSGDPTPPEYRRQGLLTGGTWKAHGQSLSYLSLTNGLVTSSTVSENDDMAVTIASAVGGSELRYVGRADSVSQISLIGVACP